MTRQVAHLFEEFEKLGICRKPHREAVRRERFEGTLARRGRDRGWRRSGKLKLGDSRFAVE